ncbi:RHS repeat-associated core domain-containing protein, partial [Frankia sp. Cas4]|uniref:RHS repeat domain-containing protein n=1 Tax=Frankia sp. Cas4 TaxID=3073927 RepID=UPI002AD5614D
TGGTRSLGYDDADQLTSVSYASGGAVRSFGYDNLGRTTADTLSGPGGTLRAATYSYDNNDNRLTETLSPAGLAGSGSQSYGYDRADRLTSWTSPANVTTSYGWDGAGNRTAVNGTAASFDERNRLTSDGTATYTYTARGTRATRTAGGTTATTTFDGFDRLVSDSTSGTTTYGYDGLDRLAVRNSTTLGYAGVEKEPVADGTSTYARDPDGDLIGLGTPGGAWVPLADTHGDVVAAFTTNGAGLTDQKAFDPFGVPTTAGSANVRVGFQGSWTDPTTAKVSAEARWYTPGTGGFVSRDSVGLALTSGISANRYVYGNANPLAYNDPSGHFAPGSDPEDAIAGVLLGGAAVAAGTGVGAPVALGLALFGSLFLLSGDSAPKSAPKPPPVEPRPHWVDYDDSDDEWPVVSPATSPVRDPVIEPALKPRSTAGGRVVQVRPRTLRTPTPLPKPRIPPMPLPQLKQHAPAGPVWSGRRILRRRMVGRRRGSRWSLKSVGRVSVRTRCRRGMGRLGRVRMVTVSCGRFRRRWRFSACRTSLDLIRLRVVRAARPVVVSLPPRRPSPTHPPTPTKMTLVNTRPISYMMLHQPPMERLDLMRTEILSAVRATLVARFRNMQILLVGRRIRASFRVSHPTRNVQWSAIGW